MLAIEQSLSAVPTFTIMLQLDLWCCCLSWLVSASTCCQMKLYPHGSYMQVVKLLVACQPLLSCLLLPIATSNVWPAQASINVVMLVKVCIVLLQAANIGPRCREEEVRGKSLVLASIVLSLGSEKKALQPLGRRPSYPLYPSPLASRLPLFFTQMLPLLLSQPCHPSQQLWLLPLHPLLCFSTLPAQASDYPQLLSGFPPWRL